MSTRQSGRKVRWASDREYSEQTKQEVHLFLRRHAFKPQGPTKWVCTIPEGAYTVTEGTTRYVALYDSPGYPTAHVIAVNHAGYRDDAWCRVVIAVMRHAARQGV
jgi:hypothetical protein